MYMTTERVQLLNEIMKKRLDGQVKYEAFSICMCGTADWESMSEESQLRWIEMSEMSKRSEWANATFSGTA
jgi:hypothetical protein